VLSAGVGTAFIFSAQCIKTGLDKQIRLGQMFAQPDRVVARGEKNQKSSCQIVQLTLQDAQNCA
jgi:hypothetical protein